MLSDSDWNYIQCCRNMCQIVRLGMTHPCKEEKAQLIVKQSSSEHSLFNVTLSYVYSIYPHTHNWEGQSFPDQVQTGYNYELMI